MSSLRQSTLLIKEAITAAQLGEATKKGLKGFIHVKRDISNISPNLKEAVGGSKFGPSTLPNFHNGKTVVATGGGQDLLHLNDKIKEGIPLGTRTKKDIIKDTSPKAKEAMNRIMAHHELSEAKAFKKTTAPRTLLEQQKLLLNPVKHNLQSAVGAQAGHHSYAKVIAPESNVISAAEGKLKEGSGVLKSFRKTTGEAETLNRLLPHDKHGTTAGFEYGGKKKINRSMRKAMYKKELATPISDAKNFSANTNEVAREGGLKEALKRFSPQPEKKKAKRSLLDFFRRKKPTQ